jgi:hypothetical protein
LGGRESENKGACKMNYNVLIMPHSFCKAIVRTRFSAIIPTMTAVVLELRALAKLYNAILSFKELNCIGICLEQVKSFFIGV